MRELVYETKQTTVYVPIQVEIRKKNTILNIHVVNSQCTHCTLRNTCTLHTNVTDVKFIDFFFNSFIFER